MLTITEKHCRLGKISNNLPKHGDEEVTEFTIPVTELMLEREEINALVGDPYFDRSLFNVKGSLHEPTEGLRKFDPLKFTERYEGASVTITVAGDRELNFENVKLYDITVKPVPGGLVDLSMKIQLMPGLGQENLVLQEAQHCEVKISITDAKVALKKGGQKELPLNSFGSGEEPEQGAEDEHREEPLPKAAQQPEEDPAEFEEAAKRQVEAFKSRGRVIDGTTPRSRRGRADATH